MVIDLMVIDLMDLLDLKEEKIIAKLSLLRIRDFHCHFASVAQFYETSTNLATTVAHF